MIIEDHVLKHDADILGLDQGASDFQDLWLSEKYYFCGGSVRYMFAFNLTRSKDSIEEAFKHELHIEKLLGNEDSWAQTSIGNIRQLVNQKYFPLSQYVMRLLFEHKLVTDSIIAMIKSRASEIGNDALKGWAHEIQMFAYLQQCIYKGTGIKTFNLTLKDENSIAKEEVVFRLEKEHLFFQGV